MSITENVGGDDTSILGRADRNDLEAILAVTNTDRDAVISTV